MLTMAIKPGHDGAIAVIEDGRLLWCLESEKDSFPRYTPLTPTTLLAVAERLARNSRHRGRGRVGETAQRRAYRRRLLR